MLGIWQGDMREQSWDTHRTMMNLKEDFIEIDARDKCEGQEVIQMGRIIYGRACFEAQNSERVL